MKLTVHGILDEKGRPVVSHSLCNPCWFEVNPDREAMRLIHNITDVCCRCGNTHSSGVYKAGPKDEYRTCIHALADTVEPTN